MARDPRFKDQLRRRARDLYEKENLTVQGVADRLGVSKGRAYVLLTEAGADLRPRGPRG